MVIVAHPGTQHSYETVLALQDSGLLKRFVTGFYFRNDSALERGLQYLPGNVKRRLYRELMRRRKDGIDPAMVHTYPALELMYVIGSRLGISNRASDILLRWRNELFDRFVAQMVRRERPKIVMCFNGSAQQTFVEAKSVGTVCVLDQTIGHVKCGSQLMLEEANLNPEFADTIPWTIPRWQVERSEEETELADYIVAGSDYVKHTLLANGVQPSKIQILPYGVDTDKFRPSDDFRTKDLHLIFVGQISQRKGIKYLLEAVKQLRLPPRRVILVGEIVGSGKGLAPYSDCFEHIPGVPRYSVHTYFQRGDIFVYPSLHEGSALAIYEALASGLPVITTPNSGSVVRDGIDGFIVPIRDVEAIKEKILLLYENKDLRMEMSRNARRQAELFSWQAYRNRLGNFLQNILNAKHTVKQD